MKLKTPKVDITILQRRALRKAIWYVLDDYEIGDNAAGLHAWEVRALQKVAVRIVPVEG